MSTPEPPRGTPAEAQAAQSQLPKATDTVSAPAPTPGIALAAGRAPLGPTLPDWDPVTLSAVVSRMANELFAPAPSVPAATTSLAQPRPPAQPAVPVVPAPSAAQASLPAPIVPPAAIGPTSPFSMPLSFDALAAGGWERPWWADVPGVALPEAPEPSPPLPPSAPEPSVEAFQIDSTPDLALRPASGTVFDPHAIRREFPILQEQVNGRRLVWLDNAATTQKPRAVIDRLTRFYERENSNVHRAAHTLAARATDAYESARDTVRRFIQAPSKSEIIFVRGTTEGINLVAQSWGRRNVEEGDEVLITWLEHHANIVPWHQLCSERKATLRVAPVDDRGQVILEEYEKLLGPKTRLVAFSQVSNALGTLTPAREMIALAHRHGAKVLLDGAQSISHMQVDVQALDCDFFVFSGHKVFAPTGIGAVYGKSALLEAMPPWQGGGNMIQDVTFERIQYQGAPARFEAGTGNIADAVGLGTALDWLSRVGLDTVNRYEHDLLVYATEQLATVPGLTMIGTAPEKAAVLSFILDGQKTEEVGGLLDKEGIAVRSGHHCAQPILRRFGVEATVRASLALYNTCEDVDALVAALHRLQAGHARPR
jgi:cysteine desulfurase/selenocysteine lyase